MTTSIKLNCRRFGILVLWLVAGAVSADVGRLFFSPGKRAMLEQMRQSDAHELVEVPIEVDPAIDLQPLATEPEELKPAITINGYVRRSNGRTTIWINQENSYDGDLSASQIESDTAHMHGTKVHVTPLGDDTRVRLKAGQSYDPNAAQITDAYETTTSIFDDGEK